MTVIRSTHRLEVTWRMLLVCMTFMGMYGSGARTLIVEAIITHPQTVLPMNIGVHLTGSTGAAAGAATPSSAAPRFATGAAWVGATTAWVFGPPFICLETTPPKTLAACLAVQGRLDETNRDGISGEKQMKIISGSESAMELSLLILFWLGTES